MWSRAASHNLARYMRSAGRLLETRGLGGPPNLQLDNNYAGFQAGYLRQWFNLTRLVLVFVTYLLNDLTGTVLYSTIINKHFIFLVPLTIYDVQLQYGCVGGGGGVSHSILQKGGGAGRCGERQDPEDEHRV